MATNTINRVVMFWALGLLLFSCNKDVKNVTFEGFVYKNSNKEPATNAILFIKNYYYEGGDYDGYMPHEEFSVITNDSGFFSIKLLRSAYVQIDTARVGFSPLLQERYISRRKERIYFYLDKQ